MNLGHRVEAPGAGAAGAGDRRPGAKAAIPPCAPRAAALALLAALSAAGVGAPACASAPIGPPLDRVEADGGVGWDGLAVGMTRREVAGRLGEAMPELRKVDDPCGEATGTLSTEGRELHLSFTRDAPDGVLHTLVLQIPSEASRRDVVRALEDRLPDLRYRPSPYAPGLSEEENPKPLYVPERHPEVGILVGPEEGRVWISFLDCME